MLASASPRRADLLRSAGLRIHVRPSACDESPRPHEPAVAHALRIARAKLDAAWADGRPDVPVLAADTEVWSDLMAEPLGKPRDRKHAALVLRSLLGGHHFVTTAWALGRPGRDPQVRYETTRVWMRDVDEAELAAYLDTDEWRDKAGGYGIQGRAGALIPWINGSYSNVVGLPLAETVGLLAAAGIRPAARP